VSDAGQSPPGTFFQRYLLPALALKGVIIGGGYATGRELAEYFLSHGPLGALLAMLLATVIWSVVAALTFALALHFRAYDYRSFMARLLGRGWIVFEVCYLLFAVLLLAVFGAAAGEVTASLTGAPLIAGTLLLALAIAVVAGIGQWAVETLFKYASVLIYAVYALFIVLAVTSFGGRIGEGLGDTIADPSWLAGGVTYGSYNIVAAIMILPVLRHIATRRNALVAGVIAGPMAMLPGLVFLLAMIGFYPEILSQTLPSDFLLQQMNAPAFRIAFQIMVFAALLESGVGVVHAVNERASVAWQARRRADPPRWLRPALTVALLALCMFIAGRIGLIDLIASGYQVMAIVFLLVFVLPLVTLGAARLWRERTPALTSEEAAHV
jgi:uncharacterized membrane protein YkvI